MHQAVLLVLKQMALELDITCCFQHTERSAVNQQGCSFIHIVRYIMQRVDTEDHILPDVRWDPNHITNAATNYTNVQQYSIQKYTVTVSNKQPSSAEETCTLAKSISSHFNPIFSLSIQLLQYFLLLFNVSHFSIHGKGFYHINPIFHKFNVVYFWCCQTTHYFQNTTQCAQKRKTTFLTYSTYVCSIVVKDKKYRLKAHTVLRF